MLLFGCTFSAIRQVEGSPRNLVGLLRHLLEVLVVEGGCFNPAVAIGMYFGGFCLDLEVLLAATAGEELRLHAAGPGWKEAWLAAVLPCFNGPGRGRPCEPVGAVAAWSASGCSGGLECH